MVANNTKTPLQALVSVICDCLCELPPEDQTRALEAVRVTLGLRASPGARNLYLHELDASRAAATPEAFHRVLAARAVEASPSYRVGIDPAVEMYDGVARIFDQRGESCALRAPHPYQLRALAAMLAECADEIDRRQTRSL